MLNKQSTDHLPGILDRSAQDEANVAGRRNASRGTKVGAPGMKRFALLAALCCARPAMAQGAMTPYADRARIEQYLMDRSAEIELARSAAPDSITRDATVLVLGRHGYETAVQGKNGFVCLVARGWEAAFDWAEFWNPEVRAADCMNPQAARSILPILRLRARMAMAGRSKAEMMAAVRAAFEHHRLPVLEDGAMDYMMSKSSYLTDAGNHNMSHVMFYTRVKDGRDWGSGAAGSPVMSSPFWFFGPVGRSQTKGLPPILVFLVAVPSWSDGTPAGMHHE